MRGYGAFSLDVLQQFAKSEHSKLLNTGVSGNINKYNVRKSKGKGKGQPRTCHKTHRGNRGMAVMFL